MSINAALHALVHRGLRSMDHVNVLVAIREYSGEQSAAQLSGATRLAPDVVERCLGDLVGARLVEHNLRTSAYSYSASAEDRPAVDALALLFSQWPDTLARMFYPIPPKPLTSFSQAFRLRIDRKDK